MLESYFKYPEVLRRMRRGPLAADMDVLAEELDRIGYARATARRYLSLVASFSRYAGRAGFTESEAIPSVLVTRFLADGLKSKSARILAATAVRHVLRHVARLRVPEVSPVGAGDPDIGLLTAFTAFLRDVRGLQPRSIEGALLNARRMLQWFRDASPGRPLAELDRKDVLACGE